MSFHAELELVFSMLSDVEAILSKRVLDDTRLQRALTDVKTAKVNVGALWLTIPMKKDEND